MNCNNGWLVADYIGREIRFIIEIARWNTECWCYIIRNWMYKANGNLNCRVVLIASIQSVLRNSINVWWEMLFITLRSTVLALEAGALWFCTICYVLMFLWTFFSKHVETVYLSYTVSFSKWSWLIEIVVSISYYAKYLGVKNILYTIFSSILHQDGKVQTNIITYTEELEYLFLAEPDLVILEKILIQNTWYVVIMLTIYTERYWDR